MFSIKSIQRLHGVSKSYIDPVENETLLLTGDPVWLRNNQP